VHFPPLWETINVDWILQAEADHKDQDHSSSAMFLYGYNDRGGPTMQMLRI